MATLNIGLKVNRAITAATTVTANAYAMVTYTPSLTVPNLSGTGIDQTYGLSPMPILRFFGPSQSIPASFTTTLPVGTDMTSGNTTSTTITWTLLSGVELINTQ